MHEFSKQKYYRTGYRRDGITENIYSHTNYSTPSTLSLSYLVHIFNLILFLIYLFPFPSTPSLSLSLSLTTTPMNTEATAVADRVGGASGATIARGVLGVEGATVIVPAGGGVVVAWVE